MYFIYLNGYVWAIRDTEQEAKAIVNSYDGEKDCWYEFVEED